MTLANYSELKASVEDWMIMAGEPELSAKFPELLALCDEALRTELRIRHLKYTQQYPHTKEFEDLPADYGDMIGVKIIHDSGKENTVFPMSYFQLADRSLASSSVAHYYQILGKQIKFKPAPPTDSTAIVELYYNAHDVPLSVTNPTNEILNNYPSVYLWGVLKHGGIYVREKSWPPKWEEEYMKAVARANKEGAESTDTGPKQANPPR